MDDNLPTGILGRTAGDDPQEVHLDLEQLVGSHLGIVANSGGGKSGLIRRVLETTYGRVQHIVLDIEDEFYTLRERFPDYVIIGGDGGDSPLSFAGAEGLALAILQHGFSAIIQLNDLGADAPEFVGRFLHALIDAPRDLWRPVLVVVDEAQKFAPQDGVTLASSGVKALTGQGRKRGFTAVLASQRIAKINADVRGDLNNWLLGRVGQALDRNTMADALGFSAKEGRERLRGIKSRTFWGFGPAIADEPILFRVADVETTPVRPGQAKVPTPPPAEALREILAGLAAAEPAKPAGALNPDGSSNVYLDEIRDLTARNGRLEEDVAAAEGQREAMRAAALSGIMRARAALEDLEAKLEEIHPLKIPVLSPDVEIVMARRPEGHFLGVEEVRGVERPAGPTDLVPEPLPAEEGDPQLSKKARDFVALLDRIAPARVTWAPLATMAGGVPSGGTFNTAKRQLQSRPDLVLHPGGKLVMSAKRSPAGMSRAEAIQLWRSVLPAEGRTRDMFDVLVQATNAMTKEEIAAAIGIAPRGGNFSGSFAPLNQNDLVVKEGSAFRLVTKLPGER